MQLIAFVYRTASDIILLGFLYTKYIIISGCKTTRYRFLEGVKDQKGRYIDQFSAIFHVHPLFPQSIKMARQAAVQQTVTEERNSEH